MLKEYGKNPVKKGEVIFTVGEALSQIGIVLSGKVIMQGDCIKMMRTQGSYLALNELGQETYSATYTALEDSVVYVLPVQGEATLKNIIGKNADYRAIMISSQFRTAVELYRIKLSLNERTERIYAFAQRSYEEYKNMCRAFGFPVMGIEELEDLSPYESAQDIDENKVTYYEEGAKIPLPANKTYFSYSEEMVSIQVHEIMEFVAVLREDCTAAAEYIKSLLDALCLRPRINLYEYMYNKAQEIKKKDDVPIELHMFMNGIIEETGFQYKELQSQSANMPDLDMEQLRSKLDSLASGKISNGEQKSKEEKEADIKRDLESLKGSMEQILRYGALSDEDNKTLRVNVEHLVHAPDRMSIEDDVKKAKKAITPLVFKLYLACYRRIKEGLIEPPKAVELFMNFGMLDERLLDAEHLEFLCGIEPEVNEGPCKVVTMMEWLDLIYEGKREPSKSEFDEDYVENLRSLKKQGEITEKEQKVLLNNMDKRVEYEIMNMQMSNSRTVYGQPSSYMPILYKEAIFGYLDKILVTKKKINESVKKLLKLDYSVFYREVIYSNNDLKIINETVMKNVYPDVILFPLFGNNASMWQEVGGKNKGTPGRFCFPIMTSSNIDDLMIKMFGRFRWELCRCIQGMAWNDVKVKSLTSEYMDYIQFYRKNRDLSDEARDKIKLQIQKARNNSREIFLMDYEAWIKNEANGAMKMNKVAREIVATYCPLEKGIRTRLNAQRPYEVAQARSIRNAQKKKQEFELKIKAIQKVTPDVPDEIMNTYNFYADM
ncbi:MAG: cyclic nucleotide-binding domain-containing protein [Lachnospiraceae bacterium]|nr:cyclic nucleotide-binding domain-containing protein [Lachnospiraceae bacterium]MBO5145913.1 cyclic nucleotide-binding domain-containing protein [Lachnospiraceae bacterium]